MGPPKYYCFRIKMKNKNTKLPQQFQNPQEKSKKEAK
jgi:hypothetical protein